MNNNYDKALIDRYLKLGFKFYPIKQEERNLLSKSYSPNFVDRSIKDASELDIFNPETDFLELDLRNSGLTSFSVELSEIEIVFRKDKLIDFVIMIFKLFSSPVPCFWNDRREAIYLIFKDFSKEEAEINYFKNIALGGVGCFSHDSIVIPHVLSPTFQYRCSWLFPARSIMKLKPCKFNNQEIFIPDLPLNLNSVLIDSPEYYRALIKNLPNSIRNLLGF